MSVGCKPHPPGLPPYFSSSLPTEAPHPLLLNPPRSRKLPAGSIHFHFQGRIPIFIQQPSLPRQPPRTRESPKLHATASSYFVAAYDKIQGKMAFFDRSRPHDFIFISGTKMRNLAKMRENPPDGFMCPGGWKVLVEYYNSIAPRAKLEEHATA